MISNYLRLLLLLPLSPPPPTHTHIASLAQSRLPDKKKKGPPISGSPPAPSKSGPMRYTHSTRVYYNPLNTALCRRGDRKAKYAAHSAQEGGAEMDPIESCRKGRTFCTCTLLGCCSEVECGPLYSQDPVCIPCRQLSPLLCGQPCRKNASYGRRFVQPPIL